MSKQEWSQIQKERSASRRAVIASQTSRLPMAQRWLNVLLMALIGGAVIGGSILTVVKLLRLAGVNLIEPSRDWSLLGIPILFMLVATTLQFLVDPRSRALRRGFAHAVLAEKCRKLGEFEKGIQHFEQAANDLGLVMNRNPAVKPRLAEVYLNLGQMQAALGNYGASYRYYSLAKRTAPTEREADQSSYEMVLVGLHLDAERPQAEAELSALAERSQTSTGLAALVALALLAMNRGDWARFVHYRSEALKHAVSKTADHSVIKTIALLSMACSQVGDVNGAAETAALARQVRERLIASVPVFPTIDWQIAAPLVLDYDAMRSEQAITEAAALLSEGNALWLWEDFQAAVDLAYQGARKIIERYDAALITNELEKWDKATKINLGKMAIRREEQKESFWREYYASGGRVFVFLDDLAKDDFDFHDYFGFSLTRLLGVERALEQERSALAEADTLGDRRQEVEQLVHISAIYQTANDWSLARHYQSQGLEVARSHGNEQLRLACLLRLLALTLRANGRADTAELDSMFNEARSLLSHTDDSYFHACGLCKLGVLRFASGNGELAVEHFREAIELFRLAALDPFQAALNVQLGRILEDLKRWADALISYKEAQSLAQRFSFVSVHLLEATAGRARCLWELRQPDAALEQCRSYLATSERVETQSGSSFISSGFRANEREAVNKLMLQILHENSGDDVLVFERADSSKGGAPVSLEQLRTSSRRSPSPVILAEYCTFRDYALLFVVDDRANLNTYRLPVSLQHLQDCMELFTEEIWRYRQWHGKLANTWQELAHPLVEPLIPHLHEGAVLIVIPDGFLHRFPFHAMSHNGRCLIDYCPVGYAPSAATLTRSAKRQTGAWKNAIVVGNPNWDLAEATNEVREVAKLFATVPRVGVDAKFDLHREIINTDVLHLATHGLFDPDHPRLSGVLMADELLTIPKISEMHIRAELVTLSGCETALSRIDPGNQLTGLTNAFLGIGVPSVLVSLWNADDAATATLMLDFYRQLKAGTPSLAHALRSAQLRMRRMDRWSHPYFWAPFVLIGDWH